MSRQQKCRVASCFARLALKQNVDIGTIVKGAVVVRFLPVSLTPSCWMFTVYRFMAAYTISLLLAAAAAVITVGNYLFFLFDLCPD